MNHTSTPLLQAVSPTLKYLGGITLQNPHTFTIERGKTYAVVGSNGCGKTTLANIIENGWNFTTNRIIGDKKSLEIRSVEFSDIHALTGFSEAYYQQRFESMANDDIPTVRQLIDGKISLDVWNDLCQRLHTGDIIDKHINFLSSGELRKFLIINILTFSPDILIVDNPYIGLDEQSRELLNHLLQNIVAQGTTVMLLLCDPAHIPPFTQHIIPMSNMQIGRTIDVDSNNFAEAIEQCQGLFKPRQLPKLSQWKVDSHERFSTAFSLNGCNVMYGSHVILKQVCWRVAAGEKWALLGENGSGKSTLLSLVCADNPQGYCNDITIFDHQRGSGESIWDIKRNISYISPEMHLYFRGNRHVLEVVASGLHDVKGLYVHASNEQCQQAMQWLEVFGIAHLAERRFSTLSSGEQRLVLLARTLLKPAALLILDEPLHGLDVSMKRLASNVIEHITANPDVTLVYVTHYRGEIPPTVQRTFTLTKYRAEEIE
ncbi:MAG: ATP-binding cassette domain-containing protein [Muribaculaceae bacterium]